MKKIGIFVCFVLLIAFGKSSQVFAYEPIDYWYSTSNKIYSYVGVSSITYSKERYYGCNMPLALLTSTVSSAESDWDDVFEIDLYATVSDETIDIDCVPRSITEYLGVSDTAVGVTFKYGNTTPYATFAKPGGGIVTFHELDSALVFLIWDETDDETTKTSDFTSYEWWYVTAHELGHALGYDGHSIYSNQLMYWTWAQGICPEQVTQYDILHMNLVYSLE